MPIGRYIAWVGSSLVALLFVLNWLIPQPEPEPVARMIEKPVIRITSVPQLPERVDIDTSQPTIVPPLIFAEEVHAQPPVMESYALAAQPRSLLSKMGKDRLKLNGRKVEAKRRSVPGTVIGEPARTVSLTKLSFADIISGRLVRNLLNQ